MKCKDQENKTIDIIYIWLVAVQQLFVKSWTVCHLMQQQRQLIDQIKRLL